MKNRDLNNIFKHKPYFVFPDGTIRKFLYSSHNRVYVADNQPFGYEADLNVYCKTHWFFRNHKLDTKLLMSREEVLAKYPELTL